MVAEATTGAREVKGAGEAEVEAVEANSSSSSKTPQTEDPATIQIRQIAVAATIIDTVTKVTTV